MSEPGAATGQTGPARLSARAGGRRPGDTYVADTANDRIQVFDANGDYLRSIGASARDLAVLTAPRGLATDPTGRLFVSDTVGNRVEAIRAGQQHLRGRVERRRGTHRQLCRTGGIAIDPRGSVYVADTANARLVHLWGDSTFLAEIGGPADLGGARLCGAGSVAVAPGTGKTYVADANHNRVLAYGPEGSLRAKWGAGGRRRVRRRPGEFNHPAGIAVDGDGDVYVADRATTASSSSPDGKCCGVGLAGSGDGRFHAPIGVAVDAAGNVYVVDSENNRVEVFD